MQTTSKPDSSCFGWQLTTDFVVRCLPKTSNLNFEVESIKGKAAQYSLMMFDKDKKDVRFGPNTTFSSIFSQDTYGAGVTKGLSVLFAYLICFEESENECQSEAVVNFAENVKSASSDFFTRISNGEEISEVRKAAEKFDNQGGYYERVDLDKTKIADWPICTDCPIVTDPVSGHLVVKIDTVVSENLLYLYTSEIETYLTEEGKEDLKQPFNTGFVVVAYKDELRNISKEQLASILNKKICLEFKNPYVVPVRGDNRYTLVASILMESPDITNIRAEVGLQALYSEGRPLRFTFGAVHNQHIRLKNDDLVEKMRNTTALAPWMNFIDTKIKV